MMEYYQLNIWKKGYELLLKIYDITNKYPSEKRYSLTSQTRSSANSVIAQIAESHGRYFLQTKLECCIKHEENVSKRGAI